MNKIEVLNALETFLHDVWEGQSELDEIINVMGYNELKLVLDLAKQVVGQAGSIEPRKRVKHPYYGTGEVLSVGNAMAAVSFDIRNDKTNVVHTSTLEVLE